VHAGIQVTVLNIKAFLLQFHVSYHPLYHFVTENVGQDLEPFRLCQNILVPYTDWTEL